MNITECILEMNKLFSDLSNYRYFATKIKTPYFTLDKQFPEKYPVGRDIDIVTHPDDFQKVLEIVEMYCKSQKMIYRVIKDSPTHHRHRLESSEYFLMPNAVPTDKRRNGLPLTKLHFQFDVSSIEDSEYSGICTDDILKNIESPLFLNGIKILDDSNESLLRCIFYTKGKSQHHRDFIYAHKDITKVSSIKDASIWDAINPVIS